MQFTFERMPVNLQEIQTHSLSHPHETAALLIVIMSQYNLSNPEPFFEMFQFLLGGQELQNLSPMTKSFIRDRMNQNDKYAFIGKSYMAGATPTNNYSPSFPYVINVIDDPAGPGPDPNLVRIGLQSGGADALRFIQCRLTKTGKWVIWSDSYMSLFSDIRKPESANPWA